MTDEMADLFAERLEKLLQVQEKLLRGQLELLQTMVRRQDELELRIRQIEDSLGLGAQWQ